MSQETTIATLPRISRDDLATRLRHTTPPSVPTDLAVVDVRDSDHVGGHIRGSRHAPYNALDSRLAELVQELKNKETVVFHCSLSQQRGPHAALDFLRKRESLFGALPEGKQTVVVLDGGFTKWQEKYGEDDEVTEAYEKDIWQS